MLRAMLTQRWQCQNASVSPSSVGCLLQGFILAILAPLANPALVQFIFRDNLHPSGGWAKVLALRAKLAARLFV